MASSHSWENPASSIDRSWDVDVPPPPLPFASAEGFWDADSDLEETLLKTAPSREEATVELTAMLQKLYVT
eukprot:6582312-Alexandrium_andersonii.AAC.1